MVAVLHTPAPVPEYVPVAHGVCPDDPAGQENPAAHREVHAGDFSPAVAPYRPVGHARGVGLVMPAAQYRPTVAVQAGPPQAPAMGAPVAEVFPGGHRPARVALKLPAVRLKERVRFTAKTWGRRERNSVYGCHEAREWKAWLQLHRVS